MSMPRLGLGVWDARKPKPDQEVRGGARGIGRGGRVPNCSTPWRFVPARTSFRSNRGRAVVPVAGSDYSEVEGLPDSAGSASAPPRGIPWLSMRE